MAPVNSLIIGLALGLGSCVASFSGTDQLSGEQNGEERSPWICSQKEDVFGDMTLGCVSVGDIVTGQRLALLMTCSTREGKDGVFDLNVIRATIRGDMDFGSSPSRTLIEFADIAFDGEDPEKVGIYRRGNHFTINHEPWTVENGASQWDTLMNVAEKYQSLAIRVQDIDGVSHSGVIRLEYLREPLELMEGAGCVRNVSLY